MNTRNTLMGLTLCAAALTVSGRAQAWDVSVGNPVGDCTVSYLAGGTTLFTLNTQTFDDNGLYTYVYNLENVSDAAGLTNFSVDVSGKPIQDYFSGFGPLFGTALHDSSLGSGGQTVYAGTDSANLHTPNVSVSDSGGQITFTDLAAPIAEGQSSASQLTTPYTFFGYRPGEELFIQSTASLGGATVSVEDGSQSTYSVTTCGANVCGPGLPSSPNGIPAVPEPGSLAPFALGGLGLLGLGVRARRRAISRAPGSGRAA